LREKPGKDVLEPEDGVKEERADQGKDNERDQVLSGVHLDGRVDAREAMDPSFHWNA
jgi:hypothetical protein